MTIFDESAIRNLFDSSLKAAKTRLASLKICCSDEPDFQGLSGWVFEQTIHYCLRKELQARNTRVNIREQESLGGRAKADLVIGPVAMEIKKSGLFAGNAASRYCRYRVAAERKGCSYLYLTLEESYPPCRQAIVKGLGRQNAFFLDTQGEWRRVIKRLLKELKNHKRSN